VAEMAKEGISFHSHTHTHPNLTWLADSEVRDELSRSKKELEQRVGTPVKYLSYPFGIYDDRVKRIAREVGYEGCFSSYRGSLSNKDPYAMRRHGIYIIDTLWDLKTKISGRDGISIRFEDLKGKTINFFAKGTYLVKRLQGV
jgi:peptidoglycan/xylan/chitin deacetylase (PgdA/CDA1 family)